MHSDSLMYFHSLGESWGKVSSSTSLAFHGWQASSFDPIHMHISLKTMLASYLIQCIIYVFLSGNIPQIPGDFSCLLTCKLTSNLKPLFILP